MTLQKSRELQLNQKSEKNKSEVQTKDIQNFFERNSKQTTHHLYKRAHSDQTSKEKVVVLD